MKYASSLFRIIFLDDLFLPQAPNTLDPHCLYYSPIGTYKLNHKKDGVIFIVFVGV